MLDIKAQAQLAEATAGMMRACALATARAVGTSMVQSLSFWSRMLQSSTGRPAPALPLPSAWTDWTHACVAQDTAPAQDPAPADAAFSSYRSSGGHAVAQVIVA